VVRDTTKSKERQEFRELYEKEKKKQKPAPKEPESTEREKSTKH
jgi:hypothetical protein